VSQNGQTTRHLPYDRDGIPVHDVSTSPGRDVAPELRYANTRAIRRNGC
jgi:hypothetical protein